MPARGADPVELTDLTVIRQWSLAVRGGTAAREDLLSALREDLAWLESGRPRREPDEETDSPGQPRRRRARQGVRVSRRG